MAAVSRCCSGLLTQSSAGQLSRPRESSLPDVSAARSTRIAAQAAPKRKGSLQRRKFQELQTDQSTPADTVLQDSQVPSSSLASSSTLQPPASAVQEGRPVGPPAADVAGASPIYESTDKSAPSIEAGSTSAGASRDDVLRACLVTSAGLVGGALLIRQVSSWASSSGLPANDCSLSVPLTLQVSQEGLLATAATVAAVSAARLLLLKVSPSFAESSQRANTQVLTNLSPFDVLAVAAFPGVSEELLFRGALLPLFGMSWLGVGISGLIFGSLHLTGGRKAVFAAWAASIGVGYGALLLGTGSIWCPVLAHSAANLVAAILWKLEDSR